MNFKKCSGTPLKRTPFGPTILSIVSKVFPTRASGILLVGVVLHYQAVEHNMATFSELSLAVHLARKANQRRVNSADLISSC